MDQRPSLSKTHWTQPTNIAATYIELLFSFVASILTAWGVLVLSSLFVFPPLSPLAMSVTSDEVNYLIYRYLQESGEFAFAYACSPF